MAKQGEIDYIQKIGVDGAIHALNKPFSDPKCGGYFYDLGMVLSLLPPPPARLLDLGVGSGWTSCFFALKGYEVIAQDISDSMLELLEKNKERYGVDNVKSIMSDYESLNFEDEFDCAVFYDCLHHAEDEYSALRSVYHALKEGGILITVEPGVGHSKSVHSIKAVQEFGVTEKDMPPKKIISIAKKIGFRYSEVYLRHLQPIRLFDMRHFLRVAIHYIFGYSHYSSVVVLKK